MTIVNDFPALTLSNNNICQEVTPDQLETYIQSNYNYGIVIGLMQILYNDETIILLHISGNMSTDANPDGIVATSLGSMGWDIRNDGVFAVPDIKIVSGNGDVVIEGLLRNLQCAEGWSVKCYYFGVVPFEQ